MRATSEGHIERGLPAAAATSLAAVALAALVLGCPIQRPPIPRDYIPFRDALRDSVAEITYAELAGRPATEERLRERLAFFATIAQTDSLLAALQSDATLRPLADPVAETLVAVLDSDVADGGVRKAFRKPEGQRLAVDAVVIGFGNALRRLEVKRRG
jgi:hypothetical protein